MYLSTVFAVTTYFVFIDRSRQACFFVETIPLAARHPYLAAMSSTTTVTQSGKAKTMKSQIVTKVLTLADASHRIGKLLT
jgi:hypothetical protein